MTDLYRRSVEVILEHQAANGAYPASPTFPTYTYSWFRDGAYTAYALGLAGEHESAARFHGWAAGTIGQRADVVERAVTKSSRGEPLGQEDVLHTRYRLDGASADDVPWPNFQLDGFGTWLWALGEHVRLTGRRPEPRWVESAGLVASYLEALWRVPCYDLWEEFPDRLHPYTLASIASGLRAHALLVDGDHSETIETIERLVSREGMHDGHFVKFLGSEEVDASLLGLAVPFGVVEPDNGAMLATAKEIERTLWRGGGVHRYAGDTYYGGGEWVLLTAWLAWFRREVGHDDRAGELMAWVEEQADGEGHLPEQVPGTLNDPASYEPWRRRWGDIACPLLWSHAKYLVARSATGHPLPEPPRVTGSPPEI